MVLDPVIRNVVTREMIRDVNSFGLNDVYLLLDLPGTFWTRYEAVNEAVMKLILMPESGHGNGNGRTV